mgnify:CR=1 FL=1
MRKGFGKDNKNSLNSSQEIIVKQLIERAFSAQQNRNILEAEIIYQKLFRLNVRNQILYFNYGLLLESKKLYKEAINNYLLAIKYFPKDPNFYNKLALLNKKQGKFKDAEKLFLNSIFIDSSFEFGYINLANLYLDLGKNKKAEEIYKKIIKANPKSELGTLNLGNLLMNNGQLKEAEQLFLKAIEINPKSSNAFFQLSKFKTIKHNESFKKNLFNSKLLTNQKEIDKINIYFARSNINHLDKKYNQSKKNLILANSLKLETFKSDVERRINFPNSIYEKYSKNISGIDLDFNSRNHIFIVGMPRSGSTLIESIISLNDDVFDLGESEALPISYSKWINNQEEYSLFDLYKKEIKLDLISSQNITDKNLFNYAYLPLILRKFKGSRIIHSYRNPLDNILSIYRANFRDGYSYSSSLIDISRVLTNEKKLMQNYKNQFPNHIYSINYDSLVSNPELEIRRLINWLNFEWHEKYLSPHLNQRRVTTTSKLQVRFPINKKSLSGWENYKELLKPAINFLAKEELAH